MSAPIHPPDIVGNVVIDESVRIGSFVSINAGRHGVIRIGAGSNIKSGARIVAYGGTIEIGSRVSIGENCVLYGHGDVTIGDATAIGPLTFVGSQEHIRTAGTPLRYTGELARPVKIGDGVIVSACCIITAGVRIGDRAFVGGGSLVFDDVPAEHLAFGSPCRVVDAIGENPLLGSIDLLQSERSE